MLFLSAGIAACKGNKSINQSDSKNVSGTAGSGDSANSTSAMPADTSRTASAKCATVPASCDLATGQWKLLFKTVTIISMR
jgi:hypothetical protein